MDKKTEDALLLTYVKSTGKTVEQLKPLLEKAKEEAKEMGFPDAENIIKGRLRKKVSGMLYSEKTGKTYIRKEPMLFKGFLLGADSLRDIKESMRKKAMNAYNENSEEAKLEGRADEQGNPLDARPTIRNRKGEEIDNPDFHKPIIGNKYVRDIFGVIKKEGEKKAKLFQMTLWEGFASKFTYRPFTPMEFKCTIKTEGSGFFILNPPRPVKGEKAFRSITLDVSYEKWIKEALAERRYAHSDLETAVKSTERATDPWILVEGIVDYIDAEVNPKTGSRSITLADVDSGMTETVRVFIPKDFPLAFREYSKVMVFGRPRKWRRSEEDEYSYSMNGFSIYPIPGETIEAKLEVGKSAQGEQGETEEGWNLWED